ncbi:uncharacterized protein SAPINGB_P006279 [Magnusiomyces paraingens]|uniref:Altered inheritance of mitochondria protein 11 n=1 Tax=Magnusiomyces paraingens TaxID=2606893 RepID=A0A5E8C9A9_9ASCO|nr:uncharacterized protein SAPINGB_P006279 [Saprochaete ingens]VVT58578.1 unnamed protein product [Saprochaete ingens]
MATQYKPATIAPLTPEQQTVLQTKQMLGFLALGSLSITTALMGRKSVISRKYVPLLFDSNNRPPNFNLVKDAAVAVGIATTMTVSTFAFTAVGFAWITGISSAKDFSIKMKSLMGGAEKELQYLNAPEDPELEQLENSISQAFSGSSKK